MIGPTTAILALRELGARSLIQYALYQLQLNSGWLKRKTPIDKWQLIGLADDLVPEFVGVANIESIRRGAGPDWAEHAATQAIGRGEACLTGQLRLFGDVLVEMGFPPPWHAFAPVAGGRTAGMMDGSQHWTDYKLDELPADIKLIWEPSRLTWALELARAYAWSDEARFAEAVWIGLMDWAAANPPNTGPNWISAQEAALRLITICAAGGMLGDWLNVQQQREWARWIIGHARRIPPSLAYAKAQRNNHLLAEAAGLFTAGIVVPDWPEAQAWRRRGRDLITAALADQIFPDGGYIQHSHNYARLALEIGLWCARLGDSAGLPLPDGSLQALRRLAEQLQSWRDPHSGHLPNFGPNDGAWLLPLSAAEYGDFRPTLQLAGSVLGANTVQPPGVWDEVSLWLGVEPQAQQSSKNKSQGAGYRTAGLIGIDAEDSRAVVRAATFSSRPGHADQLHVDLWWRGRNLALDPGSYLYGGTPPWDNQLANAAVHNGVVVDGGEPMLRAGRFMWLDWSKAMTVDGGSSAGDQVKSAAFVHDGYGRLGVNQFRRVIACGDSLWVIVDELLGDSGHNLSLAWLLPDAPWRVEADRVHLSLDEGEVVLEVQAPQAGHAMYRCGELLHGQAPPAPQPQWGWTSPTYARLQPALTWVTFASADLPAQIRSFWALGTGRWDESMLSWSGWGADRKLTQVQYQGETVDL